jgi:hypothetical protein
VRDADPVAVFLNAGPDSGVVAVSEASADGLEGGVAGVNPAEVIGLLPVLNERPFSAGPLQVGGGTIMVDGAGVDNSNKR